MLRNNQGTHNRRQIRDNQTERMWNRATTKHRTNYIHKQNDSYLKERNKAIKQPRNNSAGEKRLTRSNQTRQKHRIGVVSD